MLGKFSPDEVLAYQTLKIVKIKDYRLGGLYYTFIFLILCWVVGYQILYSNDHFEKLDVSGTARITIQQPTVDHCNPQDADCKSDFRNLTELRYCKEFAGKHSLAAGVKQHHCTFSDKHSMNPLGLATGALLVPTRIDTTVQSKGCEPSAENAFSCDNEWNIKESSGVVYVADIERSTLMLAHSYGRGDIQGNSPSTMGSYLLCGSLLGGGGAEDPRLDLPLSEKRRCSQGYVSRRIRCINDKCPFLPKDPDVKEAFLQFERRESEFEKLNPASAALAQRGAARNDEARRGRRRSKASGLLAPDLADVVVGSGGERNIGGGSRYNEVAVGGGPFAIPDGDVISVGRLLKIAGVDLDRSKDPDGKPARESGTVIEVDVVYTNLHPWSSTFGNKDVEYYYDIHHTPVHDFKSESIAYGLEQSAKTRTIENRHGILIAVKVSGTFGFFSPVYLLVMLTTALGLLAGATFLTDKLAIYLLKDEKHLSVMIDSTDELNKELGKSSEGGAAASLPTPQQ